MMNCQEAEKYFTELLDNHLDHERLRQINDHLSACSRCTEELAGFAECQRLVSGLPPVDPPVGFTTGVMAEVRDAAHRPTFWQRLFSPLTIKLPLHAAAVVLMSVLAVFIYQKESRQREPARTAPPASSFQTREEADSLPSSPAKAPAVESKMQVPDEAGAQGQREKRSSPPEQPRPFSESQEPKGIIDGVQPGAPAGTPMRDDSTPAPLTPSQPHEKASSAEIGASARLEQSLPSAEAQAKGVPPPGSLQDSGAGLNDATPAVKSPASGDLREKRASMDALRSSSTLSPNHELTLRLKETARDDKSTATLPQLERFLAEPQLSKSRAEFKDLDQARQRAIKTGEPQTVWVSIGISQYDGFKKELTDLGNIEIELSAPITKKDAVSKSSDQLWIKLTILPPLPSAKPPSSR